MLNFKKLVSVLFVMVISASLFGCSPKSEGKIVGEGNSVICKTVSWTGEFSESSLKDTIRAYKRSDSGINLNADDKGTDVKIVIGENIKSYSVSRISSVGDGIEHELESYIDLAIDTSYNALNGSLSLDVFWWFDDEGSWTQKHSAWSYLVRAEDDNGEETYYYFRVNYSK